ncbi:MAG: guanylate kinase [Acidobacteriota bacterium]|jgi:guanylate kinase
MSALPPPRSDVFVVSAPSGTGKSTVIRQVLERVGGLHFGVSHTTRPRREGERDGHDYWFVDDEEFSRLEAAGEFLEWATVHGCRYGTSRGEVERSRQAGEDALLDLDVQGAQAIRTGYPEAILVFLLPPEYEDLGSRLRHRGTAGEDLDIRLQNARREIEDARRFDYLILNERVEQAAVELESIVRAARCRRSRRRELLERVAATFPAK